MIEIISREPTTEEKIYVIAKKNGQEAVWNPEQKRWEENLKEETMELFLVCMENAHLVGKRKGIGKLIVMGDLRRLL